MVGFILVTSSRISIFSLYRYDERVIKVDLLDAKKNGT